MSVTYLSVCHKVKKGFKKNKDKGVPKKNRSPTKNIHNGKAGEI